MSPCGSIASCAQSQLKTVLTRANDTFIPLDNRVAIGNEQRNSIFVSIHFNDSRQRGVQGVETYYHSPYAYDLAAAIERSLSTLPGTMNRGVHPARFRVLRNARYPSVLVECGYLSNRSEARDVADADYREKLADKIAEAIVDYRYGQGMYRRQPAVVARAGGGGASFLRQLSLELLPSLLAPDRGEEDEDKKNHQQSRTPW